jgi:hypothetical protein
LFAEPVNTTAPPLTRVTPGSRQCFVDGAEDGVNANAVFDWHCGLGAIEAGGMGVGHEGERGNEQHSEAEGKSHEFVTRRVIAWRLNFVAHSFPVLDGEVPCRFHTIVEQT